MDLTRFLRADLLLVCQELGITIGSTARKALIIEAIENAGLEDDVTDTLQTVEKRREEEKEKEKKESQALELERMKLELELRRETATSLSNQQLAPRTENVDMSRLLQPFKIGQDIGLFLVNFERACEREGYAVDTWPARLMTVIPCEAADSIARLSAEDSKIYDKVKSSLLKRFRLSAEAFRLRFRDGTGRNANSFAERAFEIKANLREWMKSADAFGDPDKILELIALEQFFQEIPESIRIWVREKSGIATVEAAADLADEYAALKGIETKGMKGSMRHSRAIPVTGRNREQKGSTEEEGPKNGHTKGEPRRREGREDRPKAKAFERKQPVVCHKCHEEGHIAVGCRKTRVAMAYESDSQASDDLMKPYLHKLHVNGMPCTVLRDSGASLDLVHPSFISREHHSGKCAWIRQVLEEHSVCLPVAEVTLKGPFGELKTEAAVSDRLPKTTSTCCLIELLIS